MKRFLRPMGLWVLALAAGLIPHAQAKLQIAGPVDQGPAVTVTGDGSLPGGWVELWVNDVSQGSVQADLAGNFSFTNQNLTQTDKIVVTQSRVWNFNTDGDTEGWSIENNAPLDTQPVQDVGTLTVSGGALVVTKTTDTSVAFKLISPPGLALDADVYRVWEYRYNNPTTWASGPIHFRGPNSTAFGGGDGGHTLAAALQMKTAMGAGVFQTAHLNPDYNVNWPSGTQVNTTSAYQDSDGDGSGLIHQMRFDIASPTGSVHKFDYIRVTEYFEYDFSDDGDTESFNPISGLTGMTVSGGALNGAIATNGTTAKILKAITAPDVTSVNANYFTHIAIGGTYTAADAASVPTDGARYYFRKFGGSITATDSVLLNNMPRDGSYFNLVGEIANGGGDIVTGDADYAGPISAMRLDFGEPAKTKAGDVVSLDYYRLQPANPYGPSDPLIVVPVELSSFSLE